MALHPLCQPLALDRPTPGAAWWLALRPGAGPEPDLAASPPSACVLLDYTAAGFDAQAFAAAGLDCPPAIARSVARRQAEFFHGRLAARAAMQVLGLPPAPAVDVGMQRQPLWPAGLCGSISHSGHWAAAWVGPTAREARAAPAWQGLGLDIEPLLAPADQAVVLAQALSAAEAADLLDSADDPAQRALRLTLAFSAKEALFKAVFAHCGRLLDFSVARCAAITDDRVVLDLTEALAPALPAGRRFDVAWLALDEATVLTYLGW